MTTEYVRVKLNQKGWDIYKEKNGFASGNIDDEGYSRFSYDYFESLFFPLPYAEFSFDVKKEKAITEDKENELVKQLKAENDRLQQGIDRAIYQLANEDISEEHVIHEIHRELADLLKGKVTESNEKRSFSF